MGSSGLDGFEFKRFNEISSFEEKLTLFLNSLDEELVTWRDYETKDGNRYIPHPIDGYACLKDDNIIAITYWNYPKKNSLTYFIHKLFPPKKAMVGSVTKKEFQRRGIRTHMRKKQYPLMQSLGYETAISFGDITPRTLRLLEKDEPYVVHIKKDNKIWDYEDLKHFKEEEK